MSLIRIQTPTTIFGEGIKKVLRKKCRIYIAKGDFSQSDIPNDPDELKNLYSGVNPKFVYLGVMDKGGSNIAWTQSGIDIDFGKIGVEYDVNGTFVRITIDNNTIGFISEMGDDDYSFLFVPDGDTTTFFALNKTTVTTDGNLTVVEDGGISKVTFKANRRAERLDDVILYKVFTDL